MSEPIGPIIHAAEAAADRLHQLAHRAEDHPPDTPVVSWHDLAELLGLMHDLADAAVTHNGAALELAWFRDQLRAALGVEDTALIDHATVQD